MAVVTKTTLKTYFESGDRPSQSNFVDLIDSLAAQGGTGTPLYVDTGVQNNTYLISVAGVSAYASGQNYAVKIANVNTSASTLNINGLGPVAITYNDGSTLTGGELPQSGVALLYHNGTSFKITNVNPATTGAITSLTGDVTGTGPGATATTFGQKPANTFLANGTAVSAAPTAISLAASQLAGRGSAGNITAISLGTGLSMAANTLSATGASGLVKIASAAANNSTTIDFVNGTGGVVLDGTYKAYQIALIDVAPATDGANFIFRTSTNGGSSYDSGVSDYFYSGIIQESGVALVNQQQSSGANSILLGQALGASAAETCSGFMAVYNPAGTGKRIVSYDINYYEDVNYIVTVRGTGLRNTAADVDAVRFLMSTGNITSGTFILYGMS